MSSIVLSSLHRAHKITTIGAWLSLKLQIMKTINVSYQASRPGSSISNTMTCPVTHIAVTSGFWFPCEIGNFTQRMKWSPFSAYHEERDVGFNLEIKEELYISMIISSTVSLAVE